MSSKADLKLFSSFFHLKARRPTRIEELINRPIVNKNNPVSKISLAETWPRVWGTNKII